MCYDAQNFSTRMLNDKCGYLRLQAQLDLSTPVIGQMVSGYITGWNNYKELFREKLNELKAQSMEYLVIDLRNNIGGFDELGMPLCELLTEDELYAAGGGIRRNGQYTSMTDYYIHGTGEFADLPVVALTNFKCVSAGDATAYNLGMLPNVTLAGITDPCGSSQAVGGISTLSGNIVTVEYPTSLVLNQKNEPNIDPRSDRISRNPVEERIPLDYDAAMAIFCEQEDYELNWALEYLQQQRY